ncbi:hypothetical protein D3C74_357270 [compost metagenome]
MIWRSCHLGFKQFLDGFVVRVFLGCLVEFIQKLSLLFRRDYFDFRNLHFRVSYYLGHNMFKMFGHPFNTCSLE